MFSEALSYSCRNTLSGLVVKLGAEVVRSGEVSVVCLDRNYWVFKKLPAIQ